MKRLACFVGAFLALAIGDTNDHTEVYVADIAAGTVDVVSTARERR